MKYLKFLLLFLSFHASGQDESSEKLEMAKSELIPAMEAFFHCLISGNLDSCRADVLAKMDTSRFNEYHFYLLGNLFYQIDSLTSFHFHRRAYEKHDTYPAILLEYALELHRFRNYRGALEIYEKYHLLKEKDYRVWVLKADCHINLNEPEMAIHCWEKGSHSGKHTGIDFAIHMVYGRSDQFFLRNLYINQIKSENHSNVENLVFLDLNWEQDWWNIAQQREFFDVDISLIRKYLKHDSGRLKILETYAAVKGLSNSEDESMVRNLLSKNKLLLDGAKIPENGKIASDLLNTCFFYKLEDPEQFFKTRGKELLIMAQKYRDAEFLNIYAWLESVVKGKVSPDTDLMGWKDYRDERFAVSYFIGLNEKLPEYETDLDQALLDFPENPSLLWYKTVLTKKQEEKVVDLLIRLISLEFRGLKSDNSRYSYALRNYFDLLKDELE